MVAYAAMGSAARLLLLAFKGLPSFHEVQAPRPAIQDQPSPSKPIIPDCMGIITCFARDFKYAFDTRCEL
jgi:hypothetical protein